MNEESMGASPMPSTAPAPQRQSRLPMILVILLLLLLVPLSLLYSSWVLNQCVAALQAATANAASSSSSEVLGITNLAVDATANQAEGGDVVNFNVTGDNSGPLSDGTVTFNTVGKGTIQSAPVGSGVCLKVSSTQATCTGVNLLSNQTLDYVVPVVVDAACGLNNGDNVGLSVVVDNQTTQDATATGNVGCVGATSSTSSTGGTTSSGNNSSKSTSSIVATINGDGSGQNTADYNNKLAACYTMANQGLLLGLFLSLLLILIVYIVSKLATRRRH